MTERSPAKRRPRAKRRVAYHHGDLRRALIEAAAATAATDGVDAIRVSTLAAQLGVTGGAPFRHFPTRLALLVAVAEEGAQRMAERIRELAAATSDPMEDERRKAAAYVRFAVEEPGYFRAISRAEVLAASPVLREMNTATATTLDNVLGRHRRGAAAPSLAARSAGMLAGQALVYGLARMLTDGLLAHVTPSEAERLALELTAVLGEGLKEPVDRRR